MYTPVKHAKSTALGKKCQPSRAPAKHRKGLFPPKRGCRVPTRTSYICYYNLHMTFETENTIFRQLPPSALSMI